MDRDLVCGLIGFAIALVYLWAASDIPVSSLGDTVGARGVPTALGYALAGVSALFVGQRLIALRSPAPGKTYVRVSSFTAPVGCMIPANGKEVHYYTPLDDTHCWRFDFGFRTDRPVVREDLLRNVESPLRISIQPTGRGALHERQVTSN